MTLEKAREFRDDVHAKFFAENSPRGTHEEVVTKNKILEAHFKDKYDNCLSENQTPYVLMDSKEMLKQLRKFISDKYNMSFSDKEILDEYKNSDIPVDLKNILAKIMEIFK